MTKTRGLDKEIREKGEITITEKCITHAGFDDRNDRAVLAYGIGRLQEMLILTKAREQDSHLKGFDSTKKQGLEKRNEALHKGLHAALRCLSEGYTEVGAHIVHGVPPGYRSDRWYSQVYVLDIEAIRAALRMEDSKTLNSLSSGELYKAPCERQELIPTSKAAPSQEKREQICTYQCKKCGFVDSVTWPHWERVAKMKTCVCCGKEHAELMATNNPLFDQVASDKKVEEERKERLDKPTKGPWGVTSYSGGLSFDGPLRLISLTEKCVDEPGLPLPISMNKANGNLITTACNACMRKNPANPQQAADSLLAMWSK